VATIPPIETSRMRLIRRISSAFKEVPGGQMLGPSFDFSQRLFNFELIDETPEAFRDGLKRSVADGADKSVPTEVPKVIDFLRQQGLVPPRAESAGEPFDITREPLSFPVSRSAALATMTRAHQGSLLAMAYTSMNGYGDVHPTIAELRVGYVPVMMPHPVTGAPAEIGEVLMTECEVVAMAEAQGDTPAGSNAMANSVTGSDGEQTTAAAPTFSLGYGACFGHNEIKAIGMAILDRTLQKGMQGEPEHAAEDPEFVLLHIDGVESMGFTLHWKMPHYVTFTSKMDRLRETQANTAAQDASSHVAANEVDPAASPTGQGEAR
jgi:alpha-D-ribose 1-methylphosphonate 5-triphosphate synthase subunit PhnI